MSSVADLKDQAESLGLLVNDVTQFVLKQQAIERKERAKEHEEREKERECEERENVKRGRRNENMKRGRKNVKRTIH